MPALGLLAFTVQARAGDYININAASTSGPPVTINIGGSNLIDLTEDIINRQSDFEALADHAFTASFKYGGVQNAFVFNANETGTSVTLSLPSIKFTKTFSGETQDDVKDQIVDFLEKDGAGVYADLIDSINQQSPVGILDGNPQAATAFLAGEAFKNFGLLSPMPTTPKTDKNNSGFSIDFSGGSIDTDAVDGEYFSLDLMSVHRFSDQVALSLSIPVQYRNYEGSAVYTMGLQLGLPITLINARNGLGWQISPFAAGAVAASVDLVNGGVLIGGGVTNRVSWRIGDFTLAMANQLAYYGGQNIDYDDYSFETHVKQPILTNGGQITWSPGDTFFADAGVSYTSFLDDAAVPNYWSPTAGVGFRFGADHASYLRIGYHGDLGHNYTSQGATLMLAFNY